MLKMYMKEFIAICDYLKKSDCRHKRRYFILEKKYLEELLNKNRYETALAKLKIWKALKWIDTEEGRLTRRIYDKEARSYKTCIKVSIDVYETLKVLVENSGV